MCPGAEQLLGQLAEGERSARVVALAFHVDYFNDPWKDPLSDRAFSMREMAYGRVQKRDDLYFTPMLMVDGRVPMLGTNAKLARETLRRALEEKPGLRLSLTLADPKPDSPSRKNLKVALAQPEKAVAGRQLLVGVATVEDRVSTKVDAGENAGKKLLNRFATHKLAVQPAKLERNGRETLEFPLELTAGSNPARTNITVFVQDEQTGHVNQAGSIRWQAEAEPVAR